MLPLKIHPFILLRYTINCRWLPAIMTMRFHRTCSQTRCLMNEFEQHTKDGYDELWYKAGVDKVVIIAKEGKFYY